MSCKRFFVGIIVVASCVNIIAKPSEEEMRQFTSDIGSQCALERVMQEENGYYVEIRDVSQSAFDALAKYQISGLTMSRRGMTNIASLRGQKLTWLRIDDKFSMPEYRLAPITGFEVLQDMPLKTVVLVNTGITNLQTLSGIKQLKDLTLELFQQEPIRDISPLSKLSNLVSLDLEGVTVANLDPLSELRLKDLWVRDAITLHDINAIKAMPLSRLDIEGSAVSNLHCLTGHQLNSLYINGTPVRDLNFVKGMLSLKVLSIKNTKITDISPLQGLKLELLDFSSETVTNGWDVIKNMTTLTCINEQRVELFWQRNNNRLKAEGAEGAGL